MGDPDDLRRRLYRPDATPEDLERYRAATPATEADTPAPPRAPAARRASILIAAALLAGCALAAAAIGTTTHPKTEPTATPRSATTTAPPGSTLAIPASDRAAFVRSLRAGRSIGLLPYFLGHPDARPAVIRTVSRADSEEHFGEGSAVIALDPSGAAAGGGRITLVLTVDRSVTAGLVLDHVDARSPQGETVKLDQDPVHADPGLPVVVSLEYQGEVPNIVRLTVPSGVHWDLVADFTD
ncbi:MAG TPA: hypothetical protein VIG76_14750 [Amnibacterium sp.]|uniref:hypothetical protein n=1 Tax=Amnibacterium sp. TaxID=1872496 RepID=UPI002F930355